MSDSDQQQENAHGERQPERPRGAVHYWRHDEAMINKTIYVPAHWSPVGKYKNVKVTTGEKTKGLFGSEKDVTHTERRFVQTGQSDCDVDGERLAAAVARAVAELRSSVEDFVVDNAWHGQETVP